MNWFRKKNKKPELSIEDILPPHEHTWKDMPWYMEEEYSGEERWALYRIIEPYICITCGERKNVVLDKTRWDNITSVDREKFYKEVRHTYRKYLKPKAVVEDMINNILLVKDPEYLDTVEAFRGTPHRRCGTSSTMTYKKEGTDAPKIEVNENDYRVHKVP